MKKLIIFSFFLVSFFSIKAQTTSSNPTKQQVHDQFRANHPDEEILTSADNPDSREEEISRRTCWEIGWIEQPSGCIGYTTYCHHTFLFWSWWTEVDTTVAGSCP